MRPNSLRQRGAAFLAVLAALSGPAPGAPSGQDHAADRPGTVRVVGENGTVFEWRPDGDAGGGAVERLSATGGLGGVKDVALYAGGRRLLVLTANPDLYGRGRKRREGLAAVFDVASPMPRALHLIPLSGEGYGTAVTADGRRAYVLAHRPGPAGAPGAGSFWVHQIDLETAALVRTLALEGPAAAIAVEPGGGRVFVSQAGRIQTFRTLPFAGSWFYRSPGYNGALYVRPGDDVLYAVREGEVVLFDAKAALARPAADRHRRRDDATAIIPIPGGAAALFFSADGEVAFAYDGGGPPAFIDIAERAVSEPAVLPEALGRARLIRPLLFPSGGDLVVGLFPSAEVVTIARPPIRARGEARSAEPEAAPAVSEAAPARPEAASPAPPSIPAPPEPEAPAPPAASAGTGVSPALAGAITGDRGRVALLVLYGPDSIIRESARARPGPDGAWSIPLPPPGTYRLVPVGEGTRPVPARPNFHTVVVREGEGRADLDFVIARVN